MVSSNHIFLLAVLAAIFIQNAGADTKVVIEDVTKLLTHDVGRLIDETPGNKVISQVINLLYCGSFPVATNSHLQYSMDYARKDLKLFQACNSFFKTSQKPESLQVECKNNKWIFNEIVCEKITCPRLTLPPEGHISTTDHTYGTTVYFWCSRGYSINGADKLFCEESGHWNLPLPTCNVSFCHALPPPQHGFVSSQQETPVDHTIEFKCETGFTLIGDAVLKCQESTRWNTTAPVCQKMCIFRNINLSSKGVRSAPEFKEVSIGSLFEEGKSVIFSCKPGYTASSAGSSICIGGAWSPPIQCKKTCLALNIANGKYTLSKDGSSVEYFCLPGYQLIGQKKLSCTSELKWDNEPPICTATCILFNRNWILSYRSTENYESIPFETEVINGTQLYSVCRGRSFQPGIITCLDGKLTPNPCIRAKLSEYGKLLLDYNYVWDEICATPYDVCSIFGYKSDGDRRCVDGCLMLDLIAFTNSSEIILGESTDSRCIKCDKVLNVI